MMSGPLKRIDPTGIDAYKPAEVARRIEDAGVTKAQLPAMQLATLAFLAGMFIALGAAAFTATMAGADLAHGPSRLLGGVVFSTGLILVVVAGAELLTGNALIVMAWVDGRIGAGGLIRNWIFAYIGNFAGALFVVVLMQHSGLLAGTVGEAARHIGESKAELAFVPALARGVLCNMLVCLAVWLTFAARSVADKLLAIVFPISAFVLLGYEHSVANMYLIPAAWAAGSPVNIAGLVGNLVPVTIGNVLGGAGGFALTYWLAYRPKP
jgi:formate/nitrite transporter